MRNELDTASGKTDVDLNLEIGILNEREQVLEKFAATPMAYEGASGVYTAEGSYQAVALCEFLQNDTLPPAYLEVQFEMAAQRYLSLGSEVKSEEDTLINETPLEMVGNNIDQSKRSDHVVENPRKADADQANKPFFVETEIGTLEHQSETPHDTQAPDGEPGGNEKPRDKPVDIPPTVAADVSLSEHVISPLTTEIADNSPPLEQEVATPPVVSFRPPDSVITPIRAEPSQHEQLDVVDRAQNIVDDADKITPSSIAKEVVSELASDATAEILDLQHVSSETPSETAAPSLEQTPIAQETEPSALGVSQTDKGEDLEDREQYVAYDDELRIAAVSSLLTELSVIAHEPEVAELQDKNDLEIQAVDTGGNQESKTRLTALYQCIEAQVSLLKTQEYEEIITGERALPVHIVSAFIELLEATGYASPDYALEVYMQKYGVAELLDSVTEFTPRKTVHTKIRTQTKLARFVIHSTMELPQTFLRGSAAIAV